MLFFFSLNIALTVLQYSFFCCLWFTLLLWAIFHDFLCWDLLKVNGHILSSMLVMSFLIWCLLISLLVIYSGCTDIPDFLFWCIYIVIRRMFMCFESGWIQLCCSDILFLTSSPQLFLNIHIESACLCLFHSLSNWDICKSFIFYTWWSLDFLLLSTHVWVSYLPYFSSRFDCKLTPLYHFYWIILIRIHLNFCLFVHSVYSFGITESV